MARKFAEKVEALSRQYMGGGGSSSPAECQYLRAFVRWIKANSPNSGAWLTVGEAQLAEEKDTGGHQER